MANLLPALTSTATKENRRLHDFYPTPRSATEAVLPHIASWPKILWEPAAGNGAIVRVLEGAGYSVIASDRYDHSAGFSSGEEFDFTKAPMRRARSIVTNPPFERAREFILSAKRLQVENMALLLKADFFSAAKHAELFALWRPRKILALNWRLDFTGAGAPHTNCVWVLWEGASASASACEFDILKRPTLAIA